MSDWMHSLAGHFMRSRVAYPGDRLLVAFDIDGTILDMRHMVRQVLLDYDRVHGTNLFHGLRVEDVDVHENQVDRFLERRALSPDQRAHVHEWYLAQRWTERAVLEAHRPYRGVMEVIRWFQIQPDTYVGLNTGRPEYLRAETLRSLNTLGAEYRVEFTSDLLHMNPRGWGQDVTVAKVAGLRAFAAQGYRTLAVVDNEPDNIAAMAEADESGEILFLHAQTLSESRRISMPRTIGGDTYDLRSLIREEALPQHVQFAWHGVNDAANLRQFLASPVHWGELDVRRDPRGRLVLRHDSFDAVPGSPDEVLLAPGEVLVTFQRAGKGAKLDVKDPGAIADVTGLVDDSGMDGADLWFNGRIDILGEQAFRQLRSAYPQAILQCPVDFVGPLVLAMPAEARRILRVLTGWGINRFSVSWQSPQARVLLDHLDDAGYDTNLYAIPDLEQFLRAALLLPRSITADFNFPEWHYFGRGAGQMGRYHHYQIETAAPATTDVA
jgi:hypothetical protein